MSTFRFSLKHHSLTTPNPLCIALLTVLLLAGTTFNTYAQVDLNYGGGDGLVEIPAETSSEVGYRIIIDPNTGKAYVNVVVDVDPDEGLNYRTFIYRLNADGSIDNGFGPVVLDTPNATDEGYGLALQTDGKIIVAGQSGANAAVWRINSDGTLDSSFGTNGKSVISSEFGLLRSVTVQSDGKIVAAGLGSVAVGGGSKFSYLVVRLLASGTKDATFGNGGIFEYRVGTTNTMEDWGAGWGIALQPNDGKILVCGYEQSAISTGQNGTVLRLTVNGSLDNSFASSGVWTTEGFTGVQYLYDVKVTGADQKILLCGKNQLSSNNSELLSLRLLSNGNFDNAYNGFGILFNDCQSTSIDEYYGIAPVSNGRHLVVGSCSNQATALLINSNGTINSTFDNDGVLLYPIGTGPRFRGCTISNNCLYLVGSYSSDISILDRNTFVIKYCLGDLVSDNEAFDNTLSSFDVFPNPGHGDSDLNVRFTISQSTDIEIDMLDLSGRELFSQKINADPGENNLQLAVGRIEPGAYFLVLKSSQEVRTIKYLKN